MGVEPTHLLGVLQRETAHTRLTEASRPNKGVYFIFIVQKNKQTSKCRPMWDTSLVEPPGVCGVVRNTKKEKSDTGLWKITRGAYIETCVDVFQVGILRGKQQHTALHRDL
jgi:hypothetical protein